MSRPIEKTVSWEWTGLFAALLILLALPFYYFTEVKDGVAEAVPEPAPTFVGSTECRDCHNPEFDSWEGSHHDLAMDVAFFSRRCGRGNGRCR